MYYARDVGRALLVMLIVGGVAAAGGKRESPSDLVDVTTVVPDVVLDMKYATDANFTGKAVYPVARCKLRRAVAARLAKAASALRANGRRLLVWDCYRPTSIQAVFWKLVPDERYVANPRKGSRHSRGAAVDVGLVDLDGNAVVLPTAFDDFSEAAHRKNALAGDKGAEARTLERAMTAAGFVAMPTEWWHFDAREAAKYPLSDEALQ